MRRPLIAAGLCVLVTIGHVVLTGCCARGRPAGDDRAMVNPTPVIRLEGDGAVFSGGLVRVVEAGGLNDQVESVELLYFNGRHWVIIGRDDAFDPDSGTPVNEWAFWWDVSDLKPGVYILRADMHQHFGGWGSTRLEVNVAPAPRGRVSVREDPGGLLGLSAEAFEDPNGSPLRHAWRLGSGAAVEGAAIQAELDPRFPLLLFSHRALNSWNALASDVYLYVPGVLFSLNDSGVATALGVWERIIADTITEKKRLRAGLTAPNQAHLDDALDKLAEAERKVAEAKRLLASTPPDEAGARRALEEAKRLIDEAIALLNQVTEERLAIEANIATLRGLFGAVGVTLLETNALIDRIVDLDKIIADKKALALPDPAKQRELDEAIRLMEEAKALLDSAKGKLLESPPRIGEARTEIEQARAKIKEAAKKIEGIAPPRPAALDTNLEDLKILFLKLGFVTGKLWLLEQITLSDPHAGLSLPDLTRDEYPRFHVPDDVQMGRPVGSTMDDNAWDDAVLFHEFDHHVLWTKNHDPAPGDHHWYDEDLSETEVRPGVKRGEKDGRALAWSEGWANFSSCAKRGDPTYIDENEDTQPAKEHFTFEKDLERDTCRNTGEPAAHPNANSGPDVEGSVSGIFWDIFDGPANRVADADADGVSIEFKWIWKAINRVPHPEDIIDFYANLKKVLTDNAVPYDDTKLRQVYTDHGVTLP